MNKKLIINLIILIIALSCLFLIGKKVLSESYSECYEYICIKSSLEQFENCKYIGWESVGFLASEEFWLCDGVKVTEHCLQRAEVRSNVSREFIFGYGRCVE